MDEGFNFKNTHYDYSKTATGPGHASIYTGTTPRYHGIIGNNWYSREVNKSIYCAEDISVGPVNGSRYEGMRSPKNLLATTLTDELKLSTQGQAKVIGISIKDRGAIMPSGHYTNGAYWYSSSVGAFMTSTFYKEKLPKWVISFNKKELPKEYAKMKWETMIPLTQMTLSDDDDVNYERSIDQNNGPKFIYDLSKLIFSRYSFI